VSNPKYSFEDCAIEMHSERLMRTRYDAEKDTFDTGVTVMQAYEMVEAVVNRCYPGRPPGTYVTDSGEARPTSAKKSKEEKVTPRVPCTVHREKSFRFSDGTVMEACTHHECLFGKGTKRHSDGVLGQTLYSIEVPDAPQYDDEDEESEDSQSIEELSVEAWASARPTEDEDGNDIVENRVEDDDDMTGEEAWYEELAHDER